MTLLNRPGILATLPATIITAIASPTARPMPSTTPAAMPLLAAGMLTLNTVSIFEAPSARLASSYSGGTASRAVSLTDMMLGSIITASTRMAARRQVPFFSRNISITAGTRTIMPTRPYTTLGIPASSSTAGRTMPAARLEATLERYTAHISPTGTPSSAAPSMPHTLVRMNGKMPNFGSAAVEAHSVPNRKFARPISRMAGRPAMTRYAVMSTTAAMLTAPQKKNTPFITLSSAWRKRYSLDALGFPFSIRFVRPFP